MYSRKKQEISVVEPCEKHVSGTFSIVARSPESGLFGVAVASGSLSVGDRVPHAKPGVGVVATQAYTNVAYGTKGLELMGRGMLPREVLDRILKEDLGRESRQVAMVDAKGNKAVFTGRRVPRWCGESTGKDYIVIGNLLAGREVVDNMAEEFERSAGDLAWRIVRALEAASESGGDRRGERSAALLVAGARSVEVEVMVNEHSAPIKELNRRLGSHFRARCST